MEKLLEKLGAEDLGDDRWYLFRLESSFHLSNQSKKVAYTLIGEITEALREKGYWSFECVFGQNVTELNVTSGWGLDAKDETFTTDTLLDCYIKAGEELL